jgi:hypothetical protein
VGFVVDKVALGSVFSSTSLSHANSHYTNCSIFISSPIIDAVCSLDTDGIVK